MRFGSATARRGFTLVELVVAAVVAALVAGSASMALSQLLNLKARSAGREQAFGRADAAAASIARDVENTLRDYDLTFAKVAVTDGGDDAQAKDEILLLGHSARRARARDDTPEGGEYELQYRVAPLNSDPKSSALWRRIDPAHDDSIDAGGVASALVAGVSGLQIQAYDGDQWLETWDSDNDGLPHAVRVTVTAKSDDGRVTAMARRVVAIDRVPIPIDMSATGDTGASGATGASGTTNRPTTGTSAGSGFTVTQPGSGAGSGAAGGSGNRGGGGTGGGGGGGNGGGGGGSGGTGGGTGSRGGGR